MRQNALQAPVRTSADLSRLWEELMGPWGFTKRSLWLLFLQADLRPTNVIMPIDDIPAEPDPEAIRNLRLVIAQVDENFASVAMLLSRPGRAAMTGSDRRWALALRDGASPEFLRWPVHLATYNRIQVFAPDDLIAAS